VTNPKFIAELRVKFLYPGGKESDGRIAVGMPTQDEDNQASCLAVIDGLSTPASTLHGGDSLQALRIALQYLAWELHAFVERGGRVVDRDGEDVDLPSTFGQLWAPLEPAG
jgi:hypothetical protein